MHLNDSGDSVNEPDLEREYFVSSEVYISNAAAAKLRKYRKGDDYRGKEKVSWLGLSGKGLTTTGYWRSATCKLTKEAKVDRCLLNIYVDESILFQTIYVHLLHQSDIRPADDSLFFRKDCLAIYCVASQRWVTGDTPEPVYLRFLRPQLRSLWISLLRSYAVPEIYGRWLGRPNSEGEQEGGLYRMWREVQLTIAQGRNLGVSKVYDPTQSDMDDGEAETELKDIHVYCEIHFNDLHCARTTVKKGLGLPEWHELFTFSDLPPFESLQIVIWKEKKVLKQSTVLGTVVIELPTFRRGELLEAWYPVRSTNLASQLQLGELRLKIKINEEIILPRSCYSALQNVLNTRNFLEWIQDLENKLQIKILTDHLLLISTYQERVIQEVQEAAEAEVKRTIASHQTLFRGNTVFTKVMEMCISSYGRTFLEASVGAIVRRLCTEKVAIEVDPIRSGKDSKNVGRHVDQLINWCKELWEQIYSARELCPRELRALLHQVRSLVEHHGQADLSIHPQRPWQSVSVFIFLRFIVPGILHPHLFGLHSGLPSPPIQRSLKLIAKVIQSLANLNTADQRDASMVGVQDFIAANIPRMKEYLKVVSTPDSSNYTRHRFEDLDDQAALINLMQHKGQLSVLDRESIPLLPYSIDPARELAIVASTVVKHSRDINRKKRPRNLESRALHKLSVTCFEIEEEALQRVNEIATRMAQERRRASVSALSDQQPPPSQSSITTIVQEESSALSTPYASGSTLEVGSRTMERLEPSTSSNHIGSEDRYVTESGGPYETAIHLMPGNIPPSQDVLEEGAKRKRSFIRGIFGEKTGTKPRH